MKIGLLGGCFNPVHNGHLRLALEAGEGLDLDRVELLPAAVPPHKPGAGMLSFSLRSRLCEAAVSGVSRLAVNRVEAEREGPSYTVDTLAQFGAQRSADTFIFILGSEDLLLLPKWHRGLEIPALADLAVAGRGQEGLAEVRAFVERTWPDAEVLNTEGQDAGQRDVTSWRLPTGRRLSWLSAGRLDISASDIRERWLADRSLAGLTPPAVERLLAERAAEVRQAWADPSGLR